MTTAKYEMTTEKYAWSDDDVEYHGSFNSHEEAMDNAIDEYPEKGYPKFFYIGKIINTHERMLKEVLPFLVDRMVDALEEAVNEFVGSDAEIVELMPGDSKKAYGEALVALAFKHCYFKRYGVEDIRRWRQVVKREQVEPSPDSSEAAPK